MNYKYDTNKNKTFNKLVTKFVPNTLYLCLTICGKTCIYLAAGIDSIGYIMYYVYLYNFLGIEYTKSLYEQHCALDQDYMYCSEYF